MPAIHSKTLLRTIQSIRLCYLVKTGISCRKGLILVCLLIFKIIGSAKIIFGAGAIYSGKLLVSIHIEFNFSFAPPAIVVYTDCHKSAYVLSLPFYVIH